MPETFRHPVDDIEPIEDRIDPQDEARRLIREAILPCLPSAGYGQMRRFAAGYNRFVVMCYLTSPEWFNGMTKRDLAARLGLSYRALMLDIQAVEASLGVRSASTPKRQENCKNTRTTGRRNRGAGPSGGPAKGQVPRDADLSP